MVVASLSYALTIGRRNNQKPFNLSYILLYIFCLAEDSLLYEFESKKIHESKAKGV